MELQLPALGQQIAAYLTEEGLFKQNVWTAAAPHHEYQCILTASDGRQITLRDDHHQRLIVTGRWPVDQKNNQVIYNDDDPPRITCTMNRSPQAIATDIRRRFLPKFNELWHLALARVEQRNRDILFREHLLSNLTEAFAGHPGQDNTIRFGSYNNGPAGKLTIYHYQANTTIHLELHYLTVEQAQAIAAALYPPQKAKI